MNLNDIQNKLKDQIAAAGGEVILVVSGELAQHKFLTKAKTKEQADKETAEKKLNYPVRPGFSFSIRDPKLLEGDGVAKDYLGSLVKDGYLTVKPMAFMPDLVVRNEDGSITQVTKELEGQPLSYRGPVQLKFRAKVGKNGRAYVDCVAVLFETKPDIFVPEQSESRNTTGWYGTQAAVAEQAAAPVSAPAAEASSPAEEAPKASSPSPW